MRRLPFAFFLVLALPVRSAPRPESLFDLEAEAKFDRMSLSQGLSENVILCIAQDSRGFVWMGTQSGLNRFDGNAVRVFRRERDNPASLVDNYISVLHEGRDGRLWIGTSGGLARWNQASEGFDRWRHDPSREDSLSSDNITAIHSTRSGLLWVGTDLGLDLLDPATGRVTRFASLAGDPSSPVAGQVTAILEDGSGDTWVGSLAGGLCRIDPASGEITRIPNPAGEGIVINALFLDRAGDIWIGSEGNGLMRLGPDGRIARYRSPLRDGEGLASDRVSNLYQDREGLLWIGTKNGLNSLEPATGIFSTYRNRPENPQSLAGNLITGVFEDGAGIVWVATEDGASRLDPRKARFSHYFYVPGDPEGLGQKVVSALLEDKRGELWVGTFGGGVDRYDRDKGRFVHYRHDETKPGSLSDDMVYRIFEDRGGRIWVATQFGGLNLFDRERDSFRSFRAFPSSAGFSSDFLFPIYEDEEGILWIGSWGGGLNRFDPRTGRATFFRNVPLDPGSLGNDIISSIEPDGKGGLWIGTFTGLDHFDPRSGRFEHYRSREDDPSSLGNNTAVCIHRDGTGALWVGTLGGLSRLDPSTGKFRRFGMEEGLPSEVVVSIEEDSEGKLWLGTFNGLSRLDTATFTFRNFGEEDGLQSRRFRTGASFRAPDGRMYFGGINGFNAFYPKDMNDGDYAPAVVLTEFLLFNKPLVPNAQGPLTESVTEGKGVRLSYRESVFSIEFSVLDFSAPASIRYAYKLEGFDREWRVAGAKKLNATYTNLRGGSYRFRVKATNSDGVWSTNEASLPIVIDPPFWETSWFYLAVLAAVATVIVLVLGYMRRLNAEVRERRRAEDAVNELLKGKDLLLKEVHHRIKNNMNTIKGLVSLQMDELEDETALAALQDTENRVQSLIVLYEKLYCSDNYREVSIRDYLPDLAGEIANNFPNRDIVTVSTELEPLVLNTNVLAPLGIIVNELVTNAMKHAFAGRDRGSIFVGASRVEGTITLVVSDDGVGIPEGLELSGGGGFGLRLVVMLAGQLGGSLAMERVNGSRFTLEFPA